MWPSTVGCACAFVRLCMLLPCWCSALLHIGGVLFVALVLLLSRSVLCCCRIVCCCHGFVESCCHGHRWVLSRGSTHAVAARCCCRFVSACAVAALVSCFCQLHWCVLRCLGACCCCGIGGLIAVTASVRSVAASLLMLWLFAACCRHSFLSVAASVLIAAWRQELFLWLENQ